VADLCYCFLKLFLLLAGFLPDAAAMAMLQLNFV
jgi:hypothetical protein